MIQGDSGASCLLTTLTMLMIAIAVVLNLTEYRENQSYTLTVSAVLATNTAVYQSIVATETAKSDKATFTPSPTSTPTDTPHQNRLNRLHLPRRCLCS